MLRKVIISLGIVFAVLVVALAGIMIFSENAQILLPVKHTEKFTSDDMSKFPKPLKTVGNSIKNADGEAVLLRGVMPIDPAKLRARNKLKSNLFEELVSDINKTGANIVRIPVHPDFWLGDKDYMWRNLSPIVEEAGKQGMYVIIDWHCIGNIETGRGQEMPYEADAKAATLEFWRAVSSYFKDTPNVIFEIFNEPENIDSDTWRRNAQDIINEIRKNQAEQLIIVGSPEFSSNLSWAVDEPVKDENVAYAAHIYPSQASFKWDKLFGEASEKYPVIITEWGFMDENRGDTKQGFLIGTAESYGKPFIEYLNNHNIGWVACWYDDTWEPPMFQEGNKDYTSFGEFVIKQLSSNK